MDGCLFLLSVLPHAISLGAIGGTIILFTTHTPLGYWILVLLGIVGSFVGRRLEYALCWPGYLECLLPFIGAIFPPALFALIFNWFGWSFG
jgi:uncharacterized membrane protein YeaQ/YmgE (transglycosylase-associated protein family)